MSEKVLVLNASSGISGDMTVGALLDLGADQEVLQEALDSLRLEGVRVVIRRVKKSALDSCDFNVILDEEHENHDHDMAYLHPGEMHHDQEHHGRPQAGGHHLVQQGQVWHFACAAAGQDHAAGPLARCGPERRRPALPLPREPLSPVSRGGQYPRGVGWAPRRCAAGAGGPACRRHIGGRGGRRSPSRGW